MGGNAFTREDAGLLFPRMSPQMYQKLKKEITERLLKHFEEVRVAIEAPEKRSYGDIDVLVCNPITPGISDAERLSCALSARLWKQNKGSDTVNLAFEWPEEEDEEEEGGGGVGFTNLPDSPPDSDTPSTNSQSMSTTKEVLFQVDVKMCTSTKALDWTLFSLAHGDLWGVLGSIIRPYGLMHSQQLGLMIGIHEIAGFVGAVGGVGGVPKHLGRVLVTDDPVSTLGFLGLDSAQYWEPFESIDQMFDYAATCRFYTAWDKRERKIDQDEEPGEEQSCTQGKSIEGSCHRFRRQVVKRDIIHRWFTVYKPAHPAPASRSADLPPIPTPVGDPIPEAETEVVAPVTARELTALQAAKSFFGASFATRYNTARHRTLLIFGARHLWADIRQLLTTEEGAKGDELGYAMKGLKRCVQPAGFDAWAQAVISRGERESLDPTACLPDELLSSFGGGGGDGEEQASGSTGPAAEADVEQKVHDFLGFSVPGIVTVRQHFSACEFDKVKEWVFGASSENANDNDEDNMAMWRLVSRLQKENDMKESQIRRAAKEAKKAAQAAQAAAEAAQAAAEAAQAVTEAAEAVVEAAEAVAAATRI